MSSVAQRNRDIFCANNNAMLLRRISHVLLISFFENFPATLEMTRFYGADFRSFQNFGSLNLTFLN
jgi:hypothetical protein